MRSIRTSTDVRRLVAVSALAAAAIGCDRGVPAPIPAAHADDATPRRGGYVTLASFGDIRSIDPANVSDGLVPEILEALFAGLVDYDADGVLQPDVAERWTVEDGGKTFRFQLREGVHFHDGTELTADDVKRSVERALHPDAPNPFATYFSSLDGFDAFQARKADALAGVSVEGRYVVAFHLKQPDATFLPLLAMPILRPVCRSAGSRYADGWHPCGAGPFQLPENGWDHGRGVTVVRHDGYFRSGLPRLDGVRFLFHVNPNAQLLRFARGDLDVLRDFLAPDLLQFQADPRWRPFGSYAADKQIGGEAMNVEMAPFDNVEVRRAVAAALDREQLRLVRASNLRVADQPIPPAVPGHDASLVGQRYDPAAALEHMRKAGYPFDPATGRGGYPYPVPYLVYRQGLQEFLAQVVAQQLAKIGIRLEIRVVNYAAFLAIRGRRRQSPMGPGLWQQDYPDANSFLEPLFHSRSINDEDSNNWSFYSNPRVDDLIDRARRELDPDARKKLTSDASAILCDEAPWAFTYSYRYYLQRQPYVRDFRIHPVFMYELSRTWLDVAAGPVGARAVLSRDALGALFGDRPTGGRR